MIQATRHTLAACASVLALAAVTAFPGAAARASVTTTGNVYAQSGSIPTNPDPNTSVGNLGVGYTADGTMTVDSGSFLLSGEQIIGFNSGVIGTATVTGAGSTWEESGSGPFYAGYSGNGTLNVQAGGTLNNFTSYVGYYTGSTGTATVTGAGSTWTIVTGTNSGDLYLGASGNGTLNVEAGGAVSNVTGYIGDHSGSAGSVTVAGTASKWTNSSDLYVGQFGNGTLNIDGGQVDVGGQLVIAGNAGSTGTVNLAGGTLDLHGHNILLGSSADRSVTFSFTSGTLRNVGQFGYSSSFPSNLDQQGGTLAAGKSAGAAPGDMFITGNYMLASAARLEVELAGNGGVAGTDSDFYLSYGNATLSGLIDVLGLGGFTPTSGESFNVLAAASIDTTGLRITPGYTYDVINAYNQTLGGNVQELQITATPEPASLALLALGGLGLLMRPNRVCR